MDIVIGNPESRTGRVLWTLEEIGADYDIDPAAPHSERVKSINPSVKVPILQDGDLDLIDSVAICQYLADNHGQATHPAGTPGRTLHDSLLRLGERPFVTGDTFIVADLILGHCAGWAEAAKFDPPDAKLATYFGRVRSRPARLRAVERGDKA